MLSVNLSSRRDVTCGGECRRFRATSPTVDAAAASAAPALEPAAAAVVVVVLLLSLSPVAAAATCV